MIWRSGTLIKKIREDIDPRSDRERAAFARACENARKRAMDFAWQNRPSVLAKQLAGSRFLLLQGGRPRLPSFLRR